MENKYIGILRRIIILLSVLLVIVCFSFGVTYSNFIYKSPDHRAVEIVVGKLTYILKINNEITNNYVVKKGNNVLNIEIESNNEIESYYKLLINNKDIDVYYLDNMPYGRINKNDKAYIKLLLVNKSNEDINCNFIVNGGYVNNSINDVKEDEGYYLIDNKLVIGTDIKYEVNGSYNLNDNLLEAKDVNWQLLSIMDDGTYEIVSDDSINYDNSICFSGSKGYNEYVNKVNDIVKSLYSEEDVLEARNINYGDIEKYYKNSIIRAKSIKKINNVYIPALLKYETNITIDDRFTNGNLGRSDINTNTIDLDYEVANNVTMVEFIINNIEKSYFINEVYYDMLINNKKYFLSSRYYGIKDETPYYGVLSVDNNIVDNVLYDGINNSNEVCVNIRPIIKLSNSNSIEIIKKED